MLCHVVIYNDVIFATDLNKSVKDVRFIDL